MTQIFFFIWDIAGTIASFNFKFENHISDDLSRSCFGRGEHVQERTYIVPIQAFLIKYPGDLFPSNTSSSDLTRLLVTSDFD